MRLLLLGLVMSSLGFSKVITRRNHGTVFVEKGKLDVGRAAWRHTFSIELPNHRNKLRWPTCTTRTAANESSLFAEGSVLCVVLRGYAQKSRDLDRGISTRARRIDALLPPPSADVKRSLLPIIGSISRDLFGTATEEDVDNVHDHIQYIRSRERLTENNVHNLTRNFQSFMIATSDRQNKLGQAVVLSNRLTNALETKITEHEKSMEVLHLYGVQLVQLQMYMAMLLEEEVSGIYKLLEGFLPPQLVPPERLKRTLNYVSEALAGQSHGFEVAYADIGYYYYRRDIVYARVGNKLYIHLKIPLKSISTVFTVYRIVNTPISLGENRNGSTIIDVKRPYFAVSDDTKFFIELRAEEYDACHGDRSGLSLCEHIFALKETSTPSCSYGLYIDSAEIIREQCRVSYSPGEWESVVIPLKENQYLISTQDKNWLHVCPGKTPSKVLSCSFCVISLACGCALRTDSLLIPPTLSSCRDVVDVSQEYGVNLPALYQFYSAERVMAFGSNDTFPDPVHYASIPNFTLVNKEFKGLIEGDRKDKYSLKKIQENVENNEVLYADKVSSLWDRLGPIMEIPTSHVTPFVVYAALGLSAVALPLSVYSLYRVIIIAKLAQGYRLEDETELHHGVSPSPTPVANWQISDELHELLKLIIWGIALAVCAMFVGIFWCFYRRVYRTRREAVAHTTIVLLLFCHRGVLEKTLLALPHGPSELEVKLKKNARFPTKHGSLLPTLIFDWNFLRINTPSQLARVVLPRCVRFAFLEGFTLRTFLREPVAMVLVARNAENVHRLYEWKLVMRDLLPLAAFLRPPPSAPADNPAFDSEEGAE